MLLKEKARRKSTNRLAEYKPYAKQAEFHASGKLKRERLFMAGNQLGKTWCAGFEVAMHVTGRYPFWWQGKVFDKANNGICGSETGELTRKGIQRILLGRDPKVSMGTGSIPADCIVKVTWARGVAELVDTIYVQHSSGGVSSIGLKSYDQGRERWQADTLDWIWCDEEPPEDIYSEAVTRTNTTFGPCFITFTPLKGMSGVVRRFMMEESEDRCVTVMTIDDAEHYTPEQREKIVASYPAHEREARAKGIPTLGSGRVFPVADEEISWQSSGIPAHWPRICGMDFGWDHPTAAAWLAWDRDTDTVYVYDCYRKAETKVSEHATVIRSKGEWIPVAWPHDGLQHDKGSGEELANQYRNTPNNLKMLPERATFPDGGNGVEAGVSDMLERMTSGRLKVASHLNEWFEEFRLYHREDGKLVKVYDDLLSATRYGLMSLRFAETNKKSEPLKYKNLGVV